MKKLILVLIMFSFSLTGVVAQKEKSSELKVKIKDGKQPDVYIDGKKVDYAIMELLDQSKIQSVNVVKGEKALNEYNAPNGVILISTKENNKGQIRISGEFKEGDPKIIIDGMLAKKGEMESLDPNNIESVDVIKNKTAIEEYNAPNGVIIITTKKGKGKLK